MIFSFFMIPLCSLSWEKSETQDRFKAFSNFHPSQTAKPVQDAHSGLILLLCAWLHATIFPRLYVHFIWHASSVEPGIYRLNFGKVYSMQFLTRKMFPQNYRNLQKVQLKFKFRRIDLHSIQSRGFSFVLLWDRLGTHDRTQNSKFESHSLHKIALLVQALN